MAHPYLAKRGFTLIEMVMVTLLLSVLFVSIAPIMAQGFTATRVSSAQIHTLTKLGNAMQRIASELRHIGYTGTNYAISVTAPNQIVFTKNDVAATQTDIRQQGSLLKLKYSNATLNLDSVLSDELQSMLFRYLTIDDVATTDATQIAFVEVTITLRDTATNTDFSARTRVALRDRL